MTQCNTLNLKLSNSQLNKLKSAITKWNRSNFKFLPSIIGCSIAENNFPHKLLLTNTHISTPLKPSANNSATNLKLSKTQLHRIGESGGLLGRLLGPLLETGLPLIGNLLKPLAKSVLITTALTATVSATEKAIHKKMFKSEFTTLRISTEEDIMRIVKFLEESGFLIKSVIGTTKNEAKEQTGGFPGMLLGTLGAILLRNFLIMPHLLVNFEIQKYY